MGRLNFLVGKSWYFLPAHSQLIAALASFVEISDAQIFRSGIKSVRVIIQLHQPVGVINNLLVEDTGHVQAYASSSALPRLVAEGKILPGQVVGQNELRSLQVLNAAKNLSSEPTAASLSGHYWNLAWVRE